MFQEGSEFFFTPEHGVSLPLNTISHLKISYPWTRRLVPLNTISHNESVCFKGLKISHPWTRRLVPLNTISHNISMFQWFENFLPLNTISHNESIIQGSEIFYPWTPFHTVCFKGLKISDPWTRRLLPLNTISHNALYSSHRGNTHISELYIYRVVYIFDVAINKKIEVWNLMVCWGRADWWIGW